VRRQAAAPPRLRGSGSRSVRLAGPAVEVSQQEERRRHALRAGVAAAARLVGKNARAKGRPAPCASSAGFNAHLSCPTTALACFEAASSPRLRAVRHDATQSPFAGCTSAVRGTLAARRLAQREPRRPADRIARSRRSRSFGSSSEKRFKRVHDHSPPCEAEDHDLPPAVVVAHVVEEPSSTFGSATREYGRFTSGCAGTCRW